MNSDTPVKFTPDGPGASRIDFQPPSGTRHAETQIGDVWRKGAVVREVVEIPECASYIRVHEVRVCGGVSHSRFLLPTHYDWERWTKKAERQ